MIVPWMIFATVIGLLLTGAAIAAERLAAALRLPTRAVWVLALLMTVAWPIAARLSVATVVPEQVHTRGSVMIPELKMASAFTMIRHALTMFTSLQTVVSRMLSGDIGRWLGMGLLVMWGLLSLMLMGRLLLTMWHLHRWRHTWRRIEVDGVAVRLSSNVGPALMGVRSMEVVIPEWVLAFDVPLRTLILRHEQEHRSAGDPLLLLSTTLIVALVPWNVALWWQSRRLRLAIEVDCDDRVLSTHPQQERYGLLLLSLAQHKTNTPTQFAPTLVESPSHLERRIIAMRNRTLPISRLRALGVSVAVIAAVALACAVESPTQPPAANQTASLDRHVSHRYVLWTTKNESIIDAVPMHASQADPLNERVDFTFVPEKLVEAHERVSRGAPKDWKDWIVKIKDDTIIVKDREKLARIRWEQEELRQKMERLKSNAHDSTDEVHTLDREQDNTEAGKRTTMTLPDDVMVALNVGSRLGVPTDYLAGNHTLRLVGEALFTRDLPGRLGWRTHFKVGPIH